MSPVNNEYLDLNDKFLSGDIKNISSFFNHFPDRVSLIEWMKIRPKNPSTIFNVEGDSSVIVVIPTADYNSSRIQGVSRKKLFKGIQQVYVESRKPIDEFFNYSHNVNLGVKEALKYKPDWIIISNDDMIPISPPSKLLDEVKKHDPNLSNVLFTNPPGTYHSFKRFIGSPTALYRIITTLHPNLNRKKRLKLWDKFDVKYIDALYENGTGFLSKITYRNLKTHLLTGSFTVLSRKFVESQKDLYDETFINGGEDTDLSLRLYQDESRFGYLNYEIGDMIGVSLGTGWPRILRNVVNEVYLSYKIEKGLLLSDLTLKKST